jgi:hypothetical protein
MLRFKRKVAGSTACNGDRALRDRDRRVPLQSRCFSPTLKQPNCGIFEFRRLG